MLYKILGWFSVSTFIIGIVFILLAFSDYMVPPIELTILSLSLSVIVGSVSVYIKSIKLKQQNKRSSTQNLISLVVVVAIVLLIGIAIFVYWLNYGGWGFM